MVWQPYDWVVSRTQENEEYDEIRIWCLDRESKPALLRIQNLPCSCYLEFPPGFLNSRSNIDGIVKTLKSILAPKKPDGTKDKIAAESILIKVDVRKNIKFLYESRPGDALYVEVINSKAMTWLHKISSMGGMFIGKEKIKYKVWETDIGNHIKLMARQNIQFCQWITGTTTPIPPEERISTVENELDIDPTTIKGISQEESNDWVTHPRLFSFDIEVYSANPKRFPMKEAASDVITMINCQYQVLDEPNTVQNFLIVHGECNPIKDATVIQCPTEKELLIQFLKLITTLDPEILVGYNTQGFDIPYIDSRIGRKFMKWGNISRIKDQIPWIKSRTTFSEAYGTKTDYLFQQLEGRIHFDLLRYVERTEKFRSFKLDFVANFYLKEQKCDVSPQEMFAIYKKYKESKTPEEKKHAIDETTRVGVYCIQDTALVTKLFHKLTVWIGSVEMCNVVCCSPSDLYTRGQQMKAIAQVYIESFHQGYIIDHQGSAYDYKGAYVKDPIPGLYDNVHGLDFSSLYPSLIRAYNICYTTFAPKPDRYKEEDVHHFDFDEEFEYKVDKESDEAKDYLKKLLKEKEGKNDDDDSDEEDDEEEEEDEAQEEEEEEPEKPVKKSRTKKITIVKKVHYDFRFLKQEIKEGVVPAIVRKLVNERKAVKKLMKTVDKDSLLYRILDKRQLALKIAANSIYGFLGVKNGLLPLIQGAITVTYMGRVSINKVNQYVIDRGYKVIYNDTDSSYVQSKETDPSKVVDEGLALAAAISEEFPKPMSIEFEKAFRMLAIKKKKYAYVQMNDDGTFEIDPQTGELVIGMKGLLGARRDNTLFQQKTFAFALKTIMNRGSVVTTADFIISMAEQLFYDQIDITDLSVNKSLGSNYKSDTASMKVFGDYLKEQGRQQEVGSRLDYVIVESNEKTQGRRMRLLEMYVEDDRGESLDKAYYLKLLKNPIDQLYEVGYNTLWAKVPDNVFWKFGTRKPKRLQNLVGYIMDALQAGWSFTDIRRKYMTVLLKYSKLQ
jgi:DNA polymerase elongation subunit (family B)